VGQPVSHSTARDITYGLIIVQIQLTLSILDVWSLPISIPEPPGACTPQIGQLTSQLQNITSSCTSPAAEHYHQQLYITALVCDDIYLS